MAVVSSSTGWGESTQLLIIQLRDFDRLAPDHRADGDRDGAEANTKRVAAAF
jgi:hypothetical protein